MRRFEAIIIGAGHAGLSTSYFLTRAGIEHAVLEGGRIGEKWRATCWDSFYLNTPTWGCDLPGHAYAGGDPDGFLSRAEVVAYLEDYARRVDAPVRGGVDVRGVVRDGDTYIVETDGETYAARAVVVASGFFARPKTPPSTAELAPDIAQAHSSAYRNPDTLPPGAVLVVGSAQSGSQIAEDLFEAGREVYLATSRAGRIPRRYRGRDGVWWALQAGVFDVPVERLPSPEARFAASRIVSGTRGGRSTNLRAFARRGIRLLGHYRGGAGHRLSFAPDLRANLAAGDELTAQLTARIDAYIERAGLDAPAHGPANTDDDAGGGAHDGHDLPETTDLDLRAAGIRSVVWATGFAMDYAFVRLAAFDAVGYPLQRRGVSPIPGLYFMGVHFQHTAKSDLFLGVGEDAAYVADAVERQLRGGAAARGR